MIYTIYSMYDPRIPIGKIDIDDEMLKDHGEMRYLYRLPIVLGKDVVANFVTEGTSPDEAAIKIEIFLKKYGDVLKATEVVIDRFVTEDTSPDEAAIKIEIFLKKYGDVLKATEVVIDRAELIQCPDVMIVSGELY